MSQVLVCLHGWGGSKESFTELREALKNTDLTILTPDLPGFGDEPEPDHPWTVDDYADWVQHWINEQRETKNEQTIMLLGHSHGGRIALKLTVRQATNNEQRTTHSTSSGQANNIHIDHLYLCASAGIYHPRMLRRSLGFLLAKIGKMFLSIPGIRSLEPWGKKLLYRLMRVHDYEKASVIMRETLRLVRNEDLTSLLPSITIPTDIFWGTKDTMTPIADGQLMHERITRSTLHVFPDMRHGIHREKAKEISDIIRSQII